MTGLAVFCVLALLTLPAQLLAQSPRKLKVYISVDMEGIMALSRD